MIMFEYQTPGILQLISRTGYKLVQENGQRIYGGPPPNWMGPPPPKGSEVFIGKLPRDIFEDTLVPIFERVGFIYEMRLMMDFSGTNRGFCFVTYSTPEEAARAVKELDRFPIRPNYRLGVTVSIDNCRLFIGGLPKDKNREEIFDEISRVTEGVVDVICYPGIADKSKSRGFAFVEYESHKAAAMARRKLLPQKILLFEQRVAVDWAEPEPMVSDEIMKNVRILYVRGLQLHTTEGNIRRFFESFSTGIEKVKKTKDFCFVHFETRAQAESAYNYIKCHEPAIIDNAVVEVAWSRPVNRTEYEARKELVRSISNGSLPGGPLPNLESITANCITRPDRGAAGLLSTKAGQDTVRRSMWLVECMQELMRVCEMHGWGVPTYQLLSNYPPAVDTPNRLYVYKVTIGDKEILATRLTLDKDDALDLAMLSTFEELATLPNVQLRRICHPMDFKYRSHGPAADRSSINGTSCSATLPGYWSVPTRRGKKLSSSKRCE
ncbi:probable RNA-binding protein 46 isoform X2 [Artemia franciscana]|uniref:probable RNA-binding protein 46 isoform X2 n=1 Tax=Artemia franciscana TaxID=6661 RepID=UPI0032DAD5C2